MHATDRARVTALGFLGAAAGTAAAGLSVLAATGTALCGHRILIDSGGHGGMPGMPGMLHDVAVSAPGPAGGLCPILLAAAVLFAACCLLIAAALARRLAVAFVAALRLVAPGAGTLRLCISRPVLVPAGVRLARRRPSRAPPNRV